MGGVKMGWRAETFDQDRAACSFSFRRIPRCRYGRLRPLEAGVFVFANLFALAPGILGDYLRIAFYKLTLAECSLSSRIQFGSFFAHPEARVGPTCTLAATAFWE